MQIKIIDMLDDARTVAKHEGKTVFCEGGSIGEIIEAEKIKEKKNIIFARKIKTIQDSPYKTIPLCPHFYECSGCSTQDISYEKELELKSNSVTNKLQRIAKLDIDTVDIQSESEYAYRNKVDLKVEKGKLGYYDRKTHNLTSITTCKIASKPIDQLINWLTTQNLSKTSKIKIRSNYLDQIQISMDDYDDTLLQELKNNPQIVEIYRISKKFELIHRKTQFIDKIGELKFIISPNSFFQVNKYNTKLLYDIAKDFLNKNADDKILDLYCGIGTTTMYIADNPNTVGVEIVKDAVEDANQNKKLNNLDTIKFIHESSENVIDKLIKEDFNVALVDPPRKGLDEKVTNAIIKSTIDKLVYISCDPATLARDLKIFTENGFTVEKIKAVDMFSKTMHVESVVLMTRVAPTK